MQTLPMVGAVLTASRIRDLANWPEIYSITLNQQLKYFLHESVPYIKADQVWNNYGETGSNTTVAIIDSGIDATHAGLSLGSKVIQNVKIVPFGNPLENQPVTDTSSGHGTHVAGTIGGTAADSNGYYKGIAPGVKLVGVGAGEVLFILTATQAYDWVLTHHEEYDIRVISNSWGSTGGGVNVRNPVVAAPGENIYSTFPVDGYAWWSGTSMATPFVAGQAALLRGANPQLTLDEVGLLIGGTTDSLDRANPAYRGELGEGRIDLFASLESLVGGTWPAQERNVFAGCNH